MRRSVFFALASLLLTGASAAQPVPSDLASQLDSLIKPDDIRDWMKQMAAEPNHVGSPHDKANADFLLAQFNAWGWDDLTCR